MTIAPLCVLLCAAAQAQVSVVTHRNNQARTGENLNETILTPSNVNPAQFGKLFAHPVDGQVYAQPLYLPAVTIPDKGVRNIVFVATEHNSVYAFDADSIDAPGDQPIWHVNLTDTGETTISAADAMNCPTLSPEIGITGTPVIDPATNTLYVVAATKHGIQFFHRLHALDVATGEERPGSPAIVDATVPGIGGDFFNPSPVKFLPYFHKNRAGLLLLDGVVYTAWTSDCDARSYHGWMIGYDAKDFHQTSIFNSTPNANQGSFWMGGVAPSADAQGNIYVVSANGKFDADANGLNLGDSIIKLASPALTMTDYFTPFNQLYLDRKDVDLGSSGAILLPDSAGAEGRQHLMVTAGKEGRIYLLDRDRLGQFHANDDSQIVQSIKDAVGPVFGGPAYFNSTLYFAASNDRVKAFPVSAAKIAASASSQSTRPIQYPGGVPAISANGSDNGIVWVIESGKGGMLHAYDASDVSHEIYTSQMNAGRDATGTMMRFAVPTIANGKVYVGTENSLLVFGLLSQP